MVAIKDWLVSNNVHRSIIDKNKAIIAISVNKDDSPDTAVTDQNTGKIVYMKKISDLNHDVDSSKNRIFVIGIDQWKKMTTKNLFISRIKNKEDNHTDKRQIDSPITDEEM